MLEERDIKDRKKTLKNSKIQHEGKIQRQNERLEEKEDSVHEATGGDMHSGHTFTHTDTHTYLKGQG